MIGLKGSFLLLITLVTGWLTTWAAYELSEKSPYYQHLPDCSTQQPIKLIQKKTSAKGIVCPMIKDEIGFLSEWVAYYELQGFSHIILYDNGSNSSLAELDPWIKDGFVTVRRNWWDNTRDKVFGLPKNKFYDMMKVKSLAEKECKEIAVKLGYEIFISVDLDEYMVPTNPAMTLMDELSQWFNKTTRGVYDAAKLNFPPTPHILEPVNLLTIEAFQTRMYDDGKMSYYTSVPGKVALRLTGAPDYTKDTPTYLAHCCDFHGCGKGSSRHNPRCAEWLQTELWNVIGKHRPWMSGPKIYHYARSLEKFSLKAATWDTAAPGKGYDVYHFLHRNLGYHFDNSAVVWGCQVREVLRRRTGEEHYLRPGDSWYRNPEFGKVVDDPEKRGRYGRGYGAKVGWSDMNPYPAGNTYQKSHKVYEEPKKTA